MDKQHIHQGERGKAEPTPGIMASRRDGDNCEGDPDEPLKTIVRVTRVTPKPRVADLGLILGVCAEPGQLPIRRSFAKGGDQKERDAQRVANVRPNTGPTSGCGDRQSENQTHRRLHLKKQKKPPARALAPFDAQLTIPRIIASPRGAPNDIKAEAKGP